MQEPAYMNCVHQQGGLCPACQEQFDEDPQAWVEFGDHADGVVRWKKLQEELAAFRPERETVPADDEDPIPF